MYDVICLKCGESRKVQAKQPWMKGEMPYKKICRKCCQIGKPKSEETLKKLRVPKKEGMDEQNYIEFSNTLSGGWYDLIPVRCQNIINDQNEICPVIENVKKGSALGNFRRHGGKFLCRSCSYTDDGKKRMSQAASYKRSEESCRKMSEAAHEKWETEWGKKQKKRLSRLAAEQIAKQRPEQYRIRGVYKSTKTGELMPYTSSYELRRCWMLDQDNTIKTYQTQVYYLGESGKDRALDIRIEYNDGKIVAEEVKAKKRMGESENISQIADSKANAKKNGWGFRVITEEHLQMTERQLAKWAVEYRKEFEGINMEDYYKEKDKRRAKKHYDKTNDKTIIDCSFCNEKHEIRRKGYEMNVKKNGRYICHLESAHKTKNNKVNPYAKEGKKQCIKCNLVKTFDCFYGDKTKKDGLDSGCIECKKKSRNKKYKLSEQ